MQELVVLVIGESDWGIGDNIPEAVKAAEKQSGKTLKQYRVFIAHPKTRVDDLGAFVYPSGEVGGQFSPKLILRVGNDAKRRTS